MDDDQQRRAPHIPRADEFARYFMGHPPKPPMHAMLVAHAKAGMITMSQMARVAGYKNYSQANLQYGTLGGMIARSLGITVPVDKYGKSYNTEILAEPIGYIGGSQFYWKIYPELVEGLQNAGLLAKDADIPHIPEEFDDGSVFFEGAVKRISINAYERNPEARAACIKKYGTRCAVCGFDFEQVYGQLGAGYIQVHHKVPISSIGTAYELNPEEDLVPVCANCHAMLHRCAPPLAVDELRSCLSTPNAIKRQ